MKTKRLWTLGLAIVVAACSSGGTLPIETTTTVCVPTLGSPACPQRASPSESVLGECTKNKVREILADFAAAYSSPTGDPLKFIADESTFQLFSDDLRNDLSIPHGYRGESILDASNRDTLGAYLAWRRQTRPTMTIDVVKFGGVSSFNSVAGFGLELTWGGVRYWGKGGIDCDQSKILILGIRIRPSA